MIEFRRDPAHSRGYAPESRPQAHEWVEPPMSTGVSPNSDVRASSSSCLDADGPGKVDTLPHMCV